MAAPKPYNGHHCHNCWNVSLWISNDEPLYRAAQEVAKRPRVSGKPLTASIVARRFLREVVGEDALTPDGARYTFKAVRAAMIEFVEEAQQ